MSELLRLVEPAVKPCLDRIRETAKRIKDHEMYQILVSINFFVFVFYFNASFDRINLRNQPSPASHFKAPAYRRGVARKSAGQL